MLVFLLLVAVSTHDDLVRGEELYRALDYEAALAVLEQVAHDETTTSPDRVEADLWLGITAAALGKNERAEDAFKSALSIDPAAKLPDDAPPRIVELFAKLPRPSVTPTVVTLPTTTAPTTTTTATPATTSPATSEPGGSMVWSIAAGTGAGIVLVGGIGLHVASYGLYAHATNASTSGLDAHDDVGIANAELTAAIAMYVAAAALGATAAVIGISASDRS